MWIYQVAYCLKESIFPAPAEQQYIGYYFGRICIIYDLSATVKTSYL